MFLTFSKPFSGSLILRQLLTIFLLFPVDIAVSQHWIMSHEVCHKAQPVLAIQVKVEEVVLDKTHNY